MGAAAAAARGHAKAASIGHPVHESNSANRPELGVFQIIGGGLPAFLDYVERELLAFDKLVHAGTLDRGNVDEHIVRSVVRLDKPEATLVIEEFNGSDSHGGLLVDMGKPASPATFAVHNAAHSLGFMDILKRRLDLAHRQAAEANNYQPNVG
jgi:hypothetical protein